MTTSTFDNIWARIISELKAGTLVQNWGAARGYSGATFQVEDVERTAVIVAGGNMQTARRVSKGEFEKVHAIWDAYLAGNYPRGKMTGLSLNTTYIISILHRLRQR